MNTNIMNLAPLDMDDYRGKGQIPDNENSVEIELPEYVKYFTTNLTVQITPIYKNKIVDTNMYVSEITENKFIVYGKSNVSFNWVVFGERTDVQKIEVEPLKSEIEILGDGPYKY